MRILTLLLLTMVGTTGQVWAQDEPETVQFGAIVYTGAANDGGALTFYKSTKDAEQGKDAITLTNGVSAALTSDDLDPIYKDLANGDFTILGSRFFIMVTPAVGHRLPQPAADGTVSFIRAEVVTPVQQARRRTSGSPTIGGGQTLPVKFYGYYSGWDPNDPATDYYGLYYVEMPADTNLSVSITATFPGVATTTVNYFDPTKTGDAQNCSVTAYVLNGTETRLGYGSNNDRTRESWYVLPEAATYNYVDGLELYGKVHLILADGATMTIGTPESPVSENSISGFGNLDIYGQGGQTEGAISAKTTALCCIYVTGNLTINGGNVSAESLHEATNSCYGIWVMGVLTINSGKVSGRGDIGIHGTTFITNGGTVNATGYNWGINGQSEFVFNGGHLEAIGGTGDNEAGIFSTFGDITLGWTNADDYIKANSFFCQDSNQKGKAVKTVSGQRFVAYNAATGTAATAIVSGTVDDVTPLAGKTLRPLDGNYVSVNSGDFTFSGSTSDTTDPFTIMTGEGENETTTHYYIYKSSDPVTLTYTGDGFVNVTGTTLSAVENKPLQRSFTMPADDVALTAAALADPTITNVAYDGAAHAPEIEGATENYTITYKQGDVDVTEAKNVGTYTCTLTGVGQYIGTKSLDFAITPRITSIAVEIVDPETTVDGHPLIISGDDAHVKVTLSPVAGEGETDLPAINGIATISVKPEGGDAKSYTVAIVNGVGHYYVTNLGQAAYDITATFDGDANHAVSTTENATTLEACKILTETTSSYDKTPVNEGGELIINVGESVTVTVNVKEIGLQRPVIDSDTGKNKAYSFASSRPLSIDAIVTVKAQTPYDIEQQNSQNSYTTCIVNGCGIQTFSHLSAGPRFLCAVFAGDDRYVNSQTTSTDLQVNKTETSTSVEVTSPVIAK